MTEEQREKLRMYARIRPQSAYDSAKLEEELIKLVEEIIQQERELVLKELKDRIKLVTGLARNNPPLPADGTGCR